jgi:hypothetical protein
LPVKTTFFIGSQIFSWRIYSLGRALQGIGLLFKETNLMKEGRWKMAFEMRGNWVRARGVNAPARS